MSLNGTCTAQGDADVAINGVNGHTKKHTNGISCNRLNSRFVFRSTYTEISSLSLRYSYNLYVVVLK